MMDLDKVLVTGSAGMIGRALPWGMKFSRAELDVRDLKKATAIVLSKAPSAILHLAALDIRSSQADPLQAHATNVIGTYNMALAARAAKIPLVLVSSGAIFGGQKGDAHDELAAPSPANIYGQSKLLSEIVARETLDDHLIVRTGWVFGGDQAHHKKFVDVAIHKAKRGETIDAVFDQWGSPTWLVDFADELGRLIKASTRGLVHLANAGSASPVDIVDEIVASLGSKSKVNRVKRDELPDQPPRAPSEALASRQTRLRPWREALQAYLKTVK